MAHNHDGNDIQTLFLDTIRNRLESSGELNKIKSEMRSMVFNDVQDGSKLPLNSPQSNGSKSPTQVVNHLVMEYLEWIGFQYTAELFAKESGSQKGSSREQAEAKLIVKNLDKELPMLLSMTMEMMKKQ